MQTNRARYTAKVRQLMRAFDVRVTGQDLLDERGTGPRQTYDEDWRIALAPDAAAFGEELFRKRLYEAVVQVYGLHRVIGFALTSVCIAFVVVTERRVVILFVFIRFTQRKEETGALLLYQRFPRSPFFHDGNVIIGKAESLQICKAPPRFPMVRIVLHAFTVFRNRFFLLADGLEHMPHPRQCTEVTRVNFDGLFQQVHCLVMLANHCVYGSSRRVTIWFVRLQPHDIPVRFYRGVCFVLLLPSHADVHPALVIIGCEFERTFEQHLCIAPLLRTHGDAGHQAQCVNIGGIPQQHIAKYLLGFADITHALQIQATNQVFAMRCQLERLFKLARGVIILAQSRQDFRLLHANRRTTGLQLGSTFERFECFSQSALHDQRFGKPFVRT